MSQPLVWPPPPVGAVPAGQSTVALPGEPAGSWAEVPNTGAPACGAAALTALGAGLGEPEPDSAAAEVAAVARPTAATTAATTPAVFLLIAMSCSPLPKLAGPVCPARHPLCRATAPLDHFDPTEWNTSGRRTTEAPTVGHA